MKNSFSTIVLISVFVFLYNNQQLLAQNNAKQVVEKNLINVKIEKDFSSGQSINFKSLPDINMMTPQILFYGNSAGTYTLSDGGYIAGTNSYKDMGKYQRFDYTGKAKLIEVRIYFSRKTKTGTADNFNLVVKEVGTSGAPGTTLYSQSYTTDVIDESQPGVVYNTFTISTTTNISNSFFAGIEWNSTIDDKFCIDADAVGEGNQQKRAWEKWEDGTYHDMYTAWKSGTTYWDADLWIAAVIDPIPNPPVLSSPANGSPNISTSPTLSWNASSGSSYYRLQVSSNSNFTSTVFDENNILGTSKQITGLSNNSTYYWRVNGSNSAGTSDWSSPTWSFTTIPGAGPNPPTLAAPSNGATNVSTSPTLSWFSSSGATAYRLQVSTASGFTTTVFDQSNITGTSQQITGLSGNTTYYWRVNASNTNGTSNWSSPVWSFITTPPSQTPNLKPAKPSGWGDIIVVSNVINTTFDGQVDNKQNIYIDFSVLDEEAVINSSFYNALFIDGVEVQRWLVSPPVNPGEYVIIYDYNIGKLAAGTHTFRIVADVTNTIQESNETDNLYQRTVALVGINDQEPSNIPDNYVLAQNFPNPFNPTTRIEYSIPESGMVTLKVHDLLGREITTLVNREMQPGKYSVNYDANKINSGIYIYTLSAGGKTFSKMMVLIK